MLLLPFISRCPGMCIKADGRVIAACIGGYKRSFEEGKTQTCSGSSLVNLVVFFNFILMDILLKQLLLRGNESNVVVAVIVLVVLSGCKMHG